MAVNASDITSGRTYELIYDGTNFNLIGSSGIQNLAITNAKIAFDGGTLATRNKIINGAMQIDQRNNGSSQSIVAAAALAYTVDRWYGYCTGANVAGQRVSGTSPSQFNYQYTGVAAVTKIAHAQRIEAANSQDLAGTTATLSVFLSNSLLTTVTWTAFYANTIDAFGPLATLTRTTIATGTFTVSSTLARFNAQISIPSAATTGIEIELSVGAQISGTWIIGRAQLEAGITATAFETRSVGQELYLSQRYYEVFNAFGGGYGIAGSVLRSTIKFQVTKRAAPTFILGSITENSNVTSSVVDSMTISEARFLITITAAGDAVRTISNNSFNAEL